MSTSDVQLILKRLDGIERNLTDAAGRLRTVELWKARIEGAQWAAGRVPILIASAGSVVAIVIALTH